MNNSIAHKQVPLVNNPVMKTNHVKSMRPLPPHVAHIIPQKIVRDIQNPIQKDSSLHTVGPRQEAQTFTLIDFRRLSREAKKAGDMLATKFMNWKDESFLLYMDTRTEWQNSPLYQQYIALTQEAMNTGRSISDIIAEKNSQEYMTFEEYKSIIEVNNRLTI
jgi:hypothetical protein